MEFNFDVDQFLPDRVTKVQFNNKYSLNSSNLRHYGLGGDSPSLATIVDRMGHASSKAQGLNHVITTFDRLLSASDQSLYVMRSEELPNVVVGIMKMGPKNLFVMDLEGRQIESKCLCVLDFYVHESMQRRGFGRELFDFVLRDLNVNPVHLAIDRPSEKFLNFLAKYYNMRVKIPQVNNFVVFDGFFKSRPRSGIGLDRRRTHLGLNSRSSRNTPPKYPSNAHARVAAQSNQHNACAVTWMPQSEASLTRNNSQLPPVSDPEPQLPSNVFQPVKQFNNYSNGHPSSGAELLLSPPNAKEMTTTLKKSPSPISRVDNAHRPPSVSADALSRLHSANIANQANSGDQISKFHVTNCGRTPVVSTLDHDRVAMDANQQMCNGMTQKQGKKQFGHVRNVAPSSFNIFGTMPLSSAIAGGHSDVYTNGGSANKKSHLQSNNGTAMRTRLW